MRSYVSFFISSLFVAALAIPTASSAQSKVFYLEDVDGTNTRLNRTVFPNANGSSLITGVFTSAVADPGSAQPYVIQGGNLSLRAGKGLKPILLYANITEGFTIDGGSRSFVFIGGSTVRSLYTMSMNTKANNGPLPDPQALYSFPDAVTPRQVATLESQFVYWSQVDQNGTSSIYQISIRGGTPQLVYSQVDGSEEGRTITALTVDSLNGVLYFCQQGATSVVKSLVLGTSTPTTLLTYDGSCNSLAVDARNGQLYVAGTPNNGGPGLAAHEIAAPSNYYRFANGKTVRSVSVAEVSFLTKAITPRDPIVAIAGDTATFYFERFKTRLGFGFKKEVSMRYPNGKQRAFDWDGDIAIFKGLTSGGYSVKYRVVLFGNKNTKSRYSKNIKFKIQ